MHKLIMLGVLLTMLSPRRISEQRAEAAQLQEQVAQLQWDLAASHAAHLALQQHHTASMEAAAQEKQQIEEQHRQIVDTLQKVRACDRQHSPVHDAACETAMLSL
jgi:hypothetical protein